MMKWLVSLDEVLRGEATRLSKLRDATIDVPTGGLSLVGVVLGLIYGACMGCFSLVNREVLNERYAYLLATTVKVPAMFLLTLLVTFPSLYVFNALVGTRLSFWAMLRLLVASLAVNLAVLASLGPIVAFFSISTTNEGYSFIVLLNVLIFAASGGLGLTFLLQTLHRLNIAAAEAEFQAPASPPSTEPKDDAPIDAVLAEEPGALDQIEGYMLGRHVKKVFVCWMVIYGVVGAQMSWVLRPYIGSPGTPFAWFRERGSNFFESVLHIIGNLLFGAL